MQLEYYAAWKVRGFTAAKEALPNVSIGTPQIEFRVSDDPSPHVEEIAMANAVASSLLQGHTLTKAEIDQLTGDARAGEEGIYVLAHASIDVGQPSFDSLYDKGEYQVAIGFDKRRYLDAFEETEKAFLASLGVAAKTDPQFRSIGRALAIKDSDGKPIFCFNGVAFGGTAYVSSPPEQKTIEMASSIASAVLNNPRLKKAATFFTACITSDETNRLQQFFDAWNALESFTHRVFKDEYEQRWLATEEGKKLISNGRQPSIYQKFKFIADHLDQANADADSEEFKRVKKQRDNTVHGEDDAPPTDKLDIDTAKRLFERYLKLYLSEGLA